MGRAGVCAGIEILQGQQGCQDMQFHAVARTLALSVAGVQALP